VSPQADIDWRGDVKCACVSECAVTCYRRRYGVYASDDEAETDEDFCECACHNAPDHEDEYQL
jgi:hypothetical protein